MGMDVSRRSWLLGAAGTGLLAAGCASRPLAKSADDIAAFPNMPGGPDLIGPKPGFARLHSNENPYGPAKSALKMVEYAGKKGAYYPDGADKPLAKLIADRHGVDPAGIVITTGSAEALSAIAVQFGQKGPVVAPRLFFDPTVMYAKRLGLASIDRVPLAPDMSIDLPALEARVSTDTGFVQLCNPNNPTGLLADAATFQAAVKRMAKKTTVVVDEAYMELVDDPKANTCIGLVKAGHDVIVARTFSKIYGMAGLRVGYTISSPETAKKIKGAVMSWMSGVGLAGALGCYEDTKFLDYSLAKIREGREMVNATTKALGLKTLPSQTNFVFFKSGKPANELRADLMKKDIAIRGQYMDYADWSRVSMGTLQDVARFCKALPEAVQA